MKRNRRGRALAALTALLFVLVAPARARAGDPYLEWFTVESPHFRVHYHGGLEDVAQRTATLAEDIQRRLAPALGYTPTEVTHILLRDTTDDANGSATALPFNTIRLFVTAPDDMSPLGDYDDWITSILTHEHTHILHVDNVHGVPALVNAIIGKTWVPNQIQPRWILEGLAVEEESRHTTGGRVVSSLFDMYLRADVLEDRFARLDEITHNVRRWPQGNLWYLYGGRFLAWITKVYGPDVLAAVSADYGQQIAQWGINRSIRRATGRTYPELYRAWKKDLEALYGAQAAEVKRRGLREGVRLTHRGGLAANPRFAPPCARPDDRSALLYHADDFHEVPGFTLLPLDGPLRAAEEDAEVVIRTRGDFRQASFDPQCGVAFDSVMPSRRRHYFSEILYQPPGTASPWGDRGAQEHWTTGMRARDPDVSPDGRKVVFVTNHAGTSTLKIADILPDGGIGAPRVLVPSARFEQAFSPRFSPDGSRVAYGVWTHGGYRDVRIVDVHTGRFTELFHDRYFEQQPTWSPDGKRLFFVSDRTGISNVYAYELEGEKLHQVTNVINGAFMPVVAPDGRTLVYVGYTHEGFDLFAMPLDESRWLEPLPAPPDHPDPPPNPPPRQWPVSPFNPWPTLRPRALDITYGDGVYGNTLSVSVTGTDIVGLHSIGLTATYQSGIDQITGSATYRYGNLPFDFSASVFRDVVPRRFALGGSEQPYDEEILGGSTGLTYTILGDFSNQTLSLTYTLSIRDAALPVGSALDPFSPVARDPFRGLLASVRLGWDYDNTIRSEYARATERGYSLALSSEYAGPETGSEETLRLFRGRLSTYVLMPWLRHHVFATNLSGGTSAGTYPTRGFFFTGGFADENVIESFESGIRQSAFVLRGYRPGQFVGQQFNLLNAEYRFPIWFVDRGISTLPVFLTSIYGTAFADYGGAFDRLDLDDVLDQYHLGVGAEVRIGLIIGYAVSGTLRIGYAKGLDDEALDPSQTYFVVVGSF